MNIYDVFKSSSQQVIIVFIVGMFLYFLNKVIFKKKQNNLSFNDYLGLTFSKKQLDPKFFLILFTVILYAVISTYLQFNYSFELKTLILNDNSPYYKILKNGFGGSAFILGIIYCFIQAGASEELLFRGVIGKRLFNRFGNQTGNIIQALIFWIMHLLIVRFMTGSWISFIQAYTFFTSFGLGLICGWVNFRNDGNGIFPSWIIHSFVNFATFLTLSCMI